MIEAIRNKIKETFEEFHQVHNISFLGIDIDVHKLRHEYRLTLLSSIEGYAKSPYNDNHIVYFLGYKYLCCDSILPNCVRELTENEMKEEKLVWNLRKEDADDFTNFYYGTSSCSFENNPSYLKMQKDKHRK